MHDMISVFMQNWCLVVVNTKEVAGNFASTMSAGAKQARFQDNPSLIPNSQNWACLLPGLRVDVIFE